MIYIVDIEAVDTRYTKQWKEFSSEATVPYTNDQVISGERHPLLRPGAFLILVVQMFTKVNNSGAK